MTTIPTAANAAPPINATAMATRAQTVDRTLRILIHSDLSTRVWVTLAVTAGEGSGCPLRLVASFELFVVVVMRRPS